MYLLVDNYDSFTYNLYALCVKCNMKLKVIKNNKFINAHNFRGIIISPGPSNPLNSGYSLTYLEKYAGKIPIFGVCLGMQCIGVYLGYKISKASKIMHGKLDRINIFSEKILFKNISENFKAVRYHSLSVKIPKNSQIVTAISNTDNTIMAIEDEKNKLFGVQFHPESYLSENGREIINNFKKFCEEG